MMWMVLNQTSNQIYKAILEIKSLSTEKGRMANATSQFNCPLNDTGAVQCTVKN